MTLRWIAVASLLLCALLPVSAAFAQPRDAIECESRNYAYTRCDVPWRDARLVRQISETRCVRGQNWGIDRRGLWVDRGCGGRFVAAGGGHRRGDDYGGGWRPGPDWDHRFVVSCESQDYRYHFCAVDLGGGGRASIARQISSSACIEGRTWGWNRAGIWVNQGCAAEFTIDRRWH
jgi:hypothetical protein